MEDKDLKIERIAVVRDLFVFCCYTGLAYIDVMNLTPDHIIKGIDDRDWIKTSRQKTNIPVNIPILPKGLNIFEKYNGNVRANSRGTLFPIISNQKVNSYLKEIADLCGIKKNLTFHIARHTFATTVTLSNGVPIEHGLSLLIIPDCDAHMNGHPTITWTYSIYLNENLFEDEQNKDHELPLFIIEYQLKEEEKNLELEKKLKDSYLGFITGQTH